MPWGYVCECVDRNWVYGGQGGQPWPVADVGGTVDHVSFNITKKSNYLNILVIYKILP